MNESVDRRLWRGVVGLMALVLLAGLAFVSALALGWNNPRPVRPPDWEAPGFPLDLSAAPNQAATLLLGHRNDDFTLEVAAHALAGSEFNGYGLVYRAQDAARCYVFAVGSDGYYAVLLVNGPEELPLVDWQQFPHVRREQQPNRLRVTCTGATCDFYINDEYAITIEDGTWLAGDVGLWVRSFTEEEATVHFSGVRVWDRE